MASRRREFPAHLSEIVPSLSWHGRRRDSAGRYGTFFKITCLGPQARKGFHRSSRILRISEPSVYLAESREGLYQQQIIFGAKNWRKRSHMISHSCICTAIFWDGNHGS